MKTNHIYLGDCLEVMATFPDSCIDTIITDAPYGLEFMGKNWDRGVPAIPFWKEMLRVSKPGATLLSFGGTRTYHRMACAIEDAGWIIKDCIMWIYASGFPKSLNIGKAIDKLQGKEVKTTYKPNYKNDKYGKGMGGGKTDNTPSDNKWNGWGTALKPAYEPIILAMKPNEGTYANNAIKYGVSGLNIDGGRVRTSDDLSKRYKSSFQEGNSQFVSETATKSGKRMEIRKPESINKGRFPANIIHDGSDEVVKGFPNSKSGSVKGKYGHKEGFANGEIYQEYKSSEGNASRFFYTAKASKSERGTDNSHPTVKPLKLMEYLCTLTKTPTGGIVLDPFLGSGTTAIACKNTGRKYVGIEKEPEYYKIAKARINAVPDRLL